MLKQHGEFHKSIDILSQINNIDKALLTDFDPNVDNFANELLNKCESILNGNDTDM